MPEAPNCQEMVELVHQLTILSLVKENVPFNKGGQLAGLKKEVGGRGSWEEVGGGCRRWENEGATGEGDEQKKGVMLRAWSKLWRKGKRRHATFKPNQPF